MTEATLDELREDLHVATLREEEARREYIRRVEYRVRRALSIELLERREAEREAT